MNASFFSGILGLQGPELIIIFVLILLLFGAKKLPEFARGMGRSLGEFRKAKDEFEQEIHRAGEEVRVEEEKKKQQARKETPSEEHIA
ncbi:MAG: twin-arginine translocase TatA/TatE family subunit [Verrucomicrobiales bacterium]|nr:twin-arginine translocase TatA/TatE family subunit [Verrucomicrobiales bacterium]